MNGCSVRRSGMLKLFVVALCWFAFSTKGHGQEKYEFFNGVRQMGMGGAAIAVVNDETSLLLNPAGLGKLRDYIITVADPAIHLGAKTQNMIGTNFLGAAEPQEVLNMTKENPGDHYHFRGQVFPSLVVPNFGMGVLYRTTMDAEVLEDESALEMNYFNDVAFVMGFNFRMLDGRLKLGFNTRVVNRTEVRRTDLDPTSTDLELDTLAQEGIGVASDVGLILTGPWAWLPSIAAVLRDAGNTSYDLKEGLFTNATESPDVTKQSLDVAVAVFPIVGKRTRTTFTAEYRDVMAEEPEEDAMKNVHVGLEMNVQDAFFLRAGMNQRYWTAGFELAVMNYQLQAATYGEEIGTATTNREDRRYVFKFSYRF